MRRPDGGRAHHGRIQRQVVPLRSLEQGPTTMAPSSNGSLDRSRRRPVLPLVLGGRSRAPPSAVMAPGLRDGLRSAREPAIGQPLFGLRESGEPGPLPEEMGIRWGPGPNHHVFPLQSGPSADRHVPNEPPSSRASNACGSTPDPDVVGP